MIAFVFVSNYQIPADQLERQNYDVEFDIRLAFRSQSIYSTYEYPANKIS